MHKRLHLAGFGSSVPSAYLPDHMIRPWEYQSAYTCIPRYFPMALSQLQHELIDLCCERCSGSSQRSHICSGEQTLQIQRNIAATLVPRLFLGRLYGWGQGCAGAPHPLQRSCQCYNYSCQVVQGRARGRNRALLLFGVGMAQTLFFLCIIYYLLEF